MNEFNYGSPHPQSLDLHLGKHEANKRAAQCYVDKLTQANAQLHSGSDDSATGLVLFDLESKNILRWQSWADTANESNPEDEFTAKLCREFLHAGAALFELRVHPTEMIRWATACLRADGNEQDRVSRATALGILGNAWQTLGDSRKAIDYSEQALTFARDIEDYRWESAALDNLGLAYAAIGQYRKALGLHQRALEISQEIDDRFNECLTLGNLGNAEFGLGNYSQAIGYHQRALTLAQETGHRISPAKSLANLGLAVVASGERVKGVEYYNEALPLARETGNRVLEAKILGNLGAASVADGDFLKAFQYHEEALHIFQETCDRSAEARILAAMGLDWKGVGNLEKAIDCYVDSLGISDKIGDVLGLATTCSFLAEALHAVGRVEDAVEVAEQALEHFVKLESPLAETIKEKMAKWKLTSPPKQSVAVVIVRGTNPDGVGIYAYVAVRTDKLDAFMEAQKHSTFFPDEYGIVIESGEGEPSEEVKERMTREYGFNHQS